MLSLAAVLSGCTWTRPVVIEEATAPDGEEATLAQVEWQGSRYEFAWVEVVPEQVSLGLNLPEKKPVERLVKENNCQVLINGGFYGRDDKPIGWMGVEGREGSAAEKNALFNGFVTIDGEGKVEIGERRAGGRVRVGLQSGPILILGSKERALAVKNDAAKRRMVLAITESGKLVFLALVEAGSSLTGPRLNDLPAVMSLVGENLGEAWVGAINLDGGSASAFKNGDFMLGEANPIGSYFCQK